MDKRELVRRHYADVLLRLCESHKLRDLTVADVVEAAGTVRQPSTTISPTSTI